jgi:IS1 family transposase
VDAESKLLVSLVVGPRTEENANALWKDFGERTDGMLPELITTDEYKVYRQAILNIYGVKIEHPPTGRRGRPPLPELMAPKDLVYAVVHKTRDHGTVVDVSIRQIFGTPEQLQQALERSTVSKQVNTSFVERYNATVRQHNSRKARKVYSFSKKLKYHQAMSWFAASYYNFCRPHLGLRLGQNGRVSFRTPAMAADISDHLWSLHEFMRYPLVHISFGGTP